MNNDKTHSYYRALIVTNRSSAHSRQVDVLQEFARSASAISEDVHIEACAIQQLVFRVGDVGELSITLEGKELHETYDAINVRNVHKFSDYADALGVYAEHNNIRFINEADRHLGYLGKVSQGFLFARHGLPTPAFTSCLGNNELLEAVLAQDILQYPIVVKHNEEMKGTENHLVKDEQQLTAILGIDRHGYLVQTFIPNEGELRVLTFGPEHQILFHKQAQPGEYLNNTSRGGTSAEVSPADVSGDILAAAHKAASLVRRQLAGVDVLLGSDGTWYILEVNHTPAIATGAFLDKKQAAYAEFIKNEIDRGNQ